MDASKLKNELIGWIKDAIDVAFTVGVLIVVLRLLLNSQTLVPLVVVTSSSMVHEDNSGFNWLTANGHNKSAVEGYPFGGGFKRGDMIITKSPSSYLYFGETKLGDVVIYDRDLVHLNSFRSSEPIIHRVVGIRSVVNDTVGGYTGTMDCVSDKEFEKYVATVAGCRQNKSCPYVKAPETGTYRFYITKGDNNPGTDQCGFNGGIALPVTDAQLRARGWIRLPYIGYVKLVFNFILQVAFKILTLGLS